MAARLLTHAPRTEAALTAALVKRGYQPRTAAATVARARELGYVGDERFARTRAETLRARGAGSLRIAADLSARGLPDALVDGAVEGSRAGVPEAEWARRALARARVPAEPTPRAWRLLAGHGFAEEVIVDVLGELG